MEQESNSYSDTKLEERQEFIGSSSNYPNYYEIFFDDQLVNTMNMLFDISNCLGSLNIEYSFLLSDLLTENNNVTSLYESQSWRTFSPIELKKNPLYVKIKSQPQLQLINWELMSHVFNYPFIKGESIFYAKRAHYPKNQKNPYDYFNFGEQKQVILFVIKNNNIEFSLNPLQSNSDQSYAGFKINKYIYTLNVWNDQSVLKYVMNCNPNIKNNKYKGYKQSLEFTQDEHSKFFTKNSQIVFPKIALSTLKENTFNDQFSQEKYFYASVKLTLSVKYDDKYFENIDKQMKSKYQQLELVFNYSPNQIDVDAQKHSISKFIKIAIIILVIVTLIGLCLGFYFYRKAKKTLQQNNLGLSDLNNLQKGLRPIDNEMKIPSGNQKYIEFKEEK